MTIEKALDALTPYRSEIPTEALNLIRSNWTETEARLLSVLDRGIANPLEDGQSAQFLYALYLCAEMKCEAAFERYISICRLPTLLIDVLIGDILTECLPEMLTRTCGGRIEPLKDLVEDDSVYEFARSAGLYSLHNLVVTGALAHGELGNYCLDLLAFRLRKRPCHVWDATITIAGKLRVAEALSVIEAAYQRGLADPGMQSFASVERGMAQPLSEEQLREWRGKIEIFNTENEMYFFARNWSAEEEFSREDSATLLLEAQTARRQRQQPTGSKIGRNEPCPCGSGKKYKKCCIDQPFTPKVLDTFNDAIPLNLADEWIGAGYYFLEQEWSYKALTCWYRGWQEVKNILPATIRNPGTEECDRLFPSCEIFSNWLVDYQSLLEENMTHDAVVVQNGLFFCQEVVERFSEMRCLLATNFAETTAYLLLALGKSEQAFSLLERMIEQYPDTAQGYAVLAATLSLDAQRFNLIPDIDRAQQLLQNAQQNASDCESWDISVRLEDLKGWQS